MTATPYYTRLYPLLVSSFGIEGADQWCAVAQVPTDVMAAVSLRPGHLHITSMSLSETLGGDLYQLLVQSATQLGAGATVTAVVVIAERNLRLEYATHLWRAESRDRYDYEYGFSLLNTPEPRTLTASGQRVPWKREELDRLRLTALAVQEGFTNLGRAVAALGMTAEQAATETEALMRQARGVAGVPHIDLSPAKPKTRKIRIG